MQFAQIEKLIDATKQMICGNVIVKIEGVEQGGLCSLLTSHHRENLARSMGDQSTTSLTPRQGCFSTESANTRPWRHLLAVNTSAVFKAYRNSVQASPAPALCSVSPQTSQQALPALRPWPQPCATTEPFIGQFKLKISRRQRTAPSFWPFHQHYGGWIG